MAIPAGTRLGTYEVTSHIGSGGMGEVYQAHDSKLDRDVAIKVLPEQFARDPERLARFQREAKMLAALNHPNIAAIYGLEQSGSTHYLVMELVPGETLAQRVKRDRALPIEEALAIAKQIAEALEAAHNSEKGIIHRDLKPANVKVTSEGRVKVLDFGLAKAFATDAAAEDPSNSPTLSMNATAQGVIMGTAAYMSPEQAKGKPVNKATDIFAFGSVLYEMLTGKQAFHGEDVGDILATVVKSDPDWSKLPPDTPQAVRTLLRRCLRKDRLQRLQDAGTLRIEIEDVLSGAASGESTSTVSAAVTPAPQPLWRRTLPIAVTAGLTALIAVVTFSLLRKPASVPLPVSRTVIPLPPSEQLPASGGSMTGGAFLALSQDGTQLAYIGGAKQQIYLRPLDSAEARPLPDTEGASSPFFSPDGRWIGFFSGGKLKKIAVSGGAALTLCDSPNPRGGTWAANDTIVFAATTTAGLVQVSAAGGAPQPLTKLKEGEAGHGWPQFLPDGKTVLYAIQGSGGSFEDGAIAAYRLDTGEQKILLRGGLFPRYVPSGYLVFYRFSDATIMAVPFDAARLEVRGTPAPALEAVSGSQFTGVGQFSFSSLGSLVYLAGGPQLFENFTLVWVDRQGNAQTLPVPPHGYSSPRLSPSGRQVAIAITEKPDSGDVWIYDLMRDSLTRLTYEGIDAYPVWTPDGKQIIYRSAHPPSAPNLVWKPADGSGPEEKLTTSEFLQSPGSVSPDGKVLAYMQMNSKATYDIFTVPLEAERKPQPFLATDFDERGMWISPDGHWAAYVSNETGRFEVYVQPFPGPGGKRQISTDGGIEIQWAPNGKELFYRSGSQREAMMAVEIQTQPSFSAGKPRVLFQGPYASNLRSGSANSDYSVGSDGRFLMLKANEQEKTQALTQINVVQNWFEELKRRVPLPAK